MTSTIGKVIQIAQWLARWGLRVNIIFVLLFNAVIELYLLALPSTSPLHILMVDAVSLLNLWFAIFLSQLVKSLPQKIQSKSNKQG